MTKRAPVPTTPPNAEQIAHRLSRRQDEMQICGYINQESGITYPSVTLGVLEQI